MTRVHKYFLENGCLTVPKSAVFRKLGVQGSELMFWFEVQSDDTETVKRYFQVTGTGNEIDKDGTYVDTFFIDNARYVFHVYEVKPK